MDKSNDIVEKKSLLLTPHSQALVSTMKAVNVIDLSLSPITSTRSTVSTCTKNVKTIIIDLEESPECLNVSKKTQVLETSTIYFLPRGRSMSKKRIEILSSIAQRSEELQVLSSFDTKNAAPDYIIA